MIFSFFMGQWTGARIRKKREAKNQGEE